MTTYQEAMKSLDLHDDIFVRTALKSFRTKVNTTKQHVHLMESKNIIIRKWIEDQLQQNGRWSLSSPYQDACKKCNSTGEIYKLEKIKFENVCTGCHGKGYKWVLYSNDEQQEINLVENRKNNLGNKFKVRCTTCLGKGIISEKNWKSNSYKFTGKIYSSTKCPQCKGYGFPFIPPNIIQNPVLTNRLAQIINTEETDYDDPLISL